MWTQWTSLMKLTYKLRGEFLGQQWWTRRTIDFWTWTDHLKRLTDHWLTTCCPFRKADSIFLPHYARILTFSGHSLEREIQAFLHNRMKLQFQSVIFHRCVTVPSSPKKASSEEKLQSKFCSSHGQPTAQRPTKKSCDEFASLQEGKLFCYQRSKVSREVAGKIRSVESTVRHGNQHDQDKDKLI